MCGIAGIVSSRGIDPREVQRLIRPLAHRGPEDEGIWYDSDVGVGLGHRRLSIVDLSSAGHQPMHSVDQRYVLTLNGEIYNYPDLRAALEAESGVPEGGWRGHSDTEVLLQGITTWGLQRTLDLSIGMFAFALWDRKDRILRLVRDRFGEKPLYYGWAGRDFVFGSELKALRAHPRFDNPINGRALRLFAARTYIPAPFSIYERLFKLPAGHMLTVVPDGIGEPLVTPPKEGKSNGGITLERYWSYRDVVCRGLNEPILDEVEALCELERALASAIRRQSIADVPVGAFLSGGIDSSTVVALYQKHSGTPVRTFSIGFEDSGFNEAEDAQRVAAHLGTVHQEHYVTVSDARDVIPLLPTIYDEPFADSSQIPTYLVSRFAREGVTVALTGDGGDELFAGYNRHFAAPRFWKHLQRVPRAVRAFTGPALSRIPSRLWGRAGRLLSGSHQPHIGSKLQKALRVAASAERFDDVYYSFLDEWSFEQSPVRISSYDESRFDLEIGDDVPDALRMMYCDAVTYLPDDILCKVDRASMAVSLETRVPFLDHCVAEVAARIPIDMKVRAGRGKHILRRLLYRYVPAELVERPKAGFAIPVGEWLRGPLRHWAEDLLEPANMAAQGWLDPKIVQRRWQQHIRGERDSTPAIWAVLMFQAWMYEQKGSVATAA